MSPTVRGSFANAAVRRILQRCFPPPLYKIVLKNEHEALLLRLPDVEVQSCCCSNPTIRSSDSAGLGLSGSSRTLQRVRGCLLSEQQLAQCASCGNQVVTFLYATDMAIREAAHQAVTYTLHH